MGDLRSHFRQLQAQRDARAARLAQAPRQVRVDDRDCQREETSAAVKLALAHRDRQREETLGAIKLVLAATPLQVYASIDPELKAREIFDASGLSGHAGAYEEILRAVKATVARANSPKAQQFLDAKALADAGGPVPAPTGLAKQILDAKALADAGGPVIPPPPPGSLGAQIIEAARKNRTGEGSKK